MKPLKRCGKTVSVLGNKAARNSAATLKRAITINALEDTLMETQTVIETTTADNMTEAQHNLREDETVLSFLENTFNRYAEEDARGRPVTLTAPEWWGLARLMHNMNETMCSALNRRK